MSKTPTTEQQIAADDLMEHLITCYIGAALIRTPTECEAMRAAFRAGYELGWKHATANAEEGS